MKLIIAGSRKFPTLSLNNYIDYRKQENSVAYLYQTLSDLISTLEFKPTEIVSGTCWGIDRIGENYARKNSIQIKKFPADWNKYGPSAGYKRNEQMALYGDYLICIHSVGSKGSINMIQCMIKQNKKYTSFEIK